MRRILVLAMILVLALPAFVPSGAVSAQTDSMTFGIPNRISFTYSTQIAQSAVWQWVAASNAVDTPTGPVPEYNEIDFQNFIDTTTGWKNTGQVIYVYPVVTFPSDPSQVFARGLANLRNVLAARPNVPQGELPMLPVLAAGQYFRAQVHYLDFQGGSGIGYVTAGGFDVSPVTDQSLFYSFQGLTSDGAYYIAGVFPLKSGGVLPDVPVSMTAAQMEQFSANFDQYLADTTQKLNALPPQNFTPNLTLLDALFTSMKVTGPAAMLLTPAQGGTVSTAYENVAFSYDAAIASRIEVDKIPPFVDTQNMSMYGSQPGYTQFTLIGYPLRFNFREAEIIVYPVDGFPNSNSLYDQRLAALKSFLAARAPVSVRFDTSGTAEIPMLPLINAAQVFVAKPQWIDFQNGTGLRFITYYAQAPNPIINGYILYSFIGITADGKSVLSIEFPIKASVLPDAIDPNFNFDTFMAGYNDYMNQTLAALDGLDAQGYAPSLDMLDSMVKSFRVGG